MEPAINDLTRELDAQGRRRLPELEVELEVVDDLLLDPWFFKTEDEMAAIEDDPTAKIIEIRLADYGNSYGTGFAASRWAF